MTFFGNSTTISFTGSPDSCGLLLMLLVCLCGFSPVQAQYRTYHDAIDQGNGCYRLTRDRDYVSGAILSQRQYSVDEDFVIACSLNFGDKDRSGADGFGFIMLPDPNALNGQLEEGEGIGYQGLPNCLVIEFDTYQNEEMGDPPHDHIALVVNADPDHQRSTISGPFPAAVSGNIEDGRDHDLLVIWEADLELLTVYFDCNKIFGYQGDIVRPFLGGSRTFYAGFTSSTGGATNEHRVCFKLPRIVDNLRDQTFCDSATITLDAGSNSRVVNWSPEQYFADPHQQRNKVAIQETTTFYLHKWDNCGNETLDSVTIYIIPNQLDVSLGNDTAICENTSLVLSVPAGGLHYQWSTGATGQTIVVDEPGIYSVEVDDGICIKQDEIHIEQRLLPQVHLPEDTLMCDHDPLTLSVPAGQHMISWQDGSTGNTFTLTEPGTYRVTATNECGTADDEIRVGYENCSLYYIPNAFTPNRDGVNDYFGPSAGSSIIELEQMLIFNRWGAQVFAVNSIPVTDETLLWDGTYKGKPADPGTYVYLIRLRMKNGKIITARGDVTLLR